MTGAGPPRADRQERAEPARLRPAGPSDAPALARILGGWVRATPWMPALHSPEEDEGFLRHLIATTAVTVAGEPPAGFLARDGAEVRALYLAPAARGQGLGRALLDRAKAESPTLVLWTFAANTGALRFYRREGFVEIARTDGDNEEGLPDVRLAWPAEAAP